MSETIIPHNPASNSPFYVRLFGSFEVSVEGLPLPRLRSRKGQLLLIMLLLHPDSEVTREWLAERLWSDSPEAQRLASLRQSLHDLRSALGSQAFRLESPTPKTLRFQTIGAFVDALQFERFCRQGTLDAEREALALYRGSLLQEWQEEALYSYQNAFQSQALELCERVAVREIEAKEYVDAIRLLRLGIGIDPLRESLYRHLLSVYATRGEYAEAIQVYRELRKHLRAEMGVDPEPETVALYQGIRANVRAQMKQLPTVEVPLHVTLAPPAQTKTPTNLPRLLTRLIGREEECKALREEVRKHQLISLLGPGGVGKTRLAREVGHLIFADSQVRFPEGIWFVELATLTDPAFVLPTLASLFGLKETPEIPLMEAFVQYLKAKPLLLIIDNCEHLREVCSEIVGLILKQAPNVHVLVTSREPLGLPEERYFRLQPLALSPEEATQETMQASPAFQLFYERALQARPRWVLSPKEIRESYQICRRLDGIPLAIELAAARLSVLTPETLLARLEDRFHLLCGGTRTALPRHQTLRAAIDWSYYLLTPDEQVLFRQLSIFAGAFSLEDAERVCGEEEVLGLLARLVERSLVVTQFTNDTEQRYQLLESLKEYGRERLREAHEYKELYARYCWWYIELAQGAYDTAGAFFRTHWVPRLRAEYDNLRTILQSPPSESVFYHLVALLSRYWVMSSEVREGKYWLELACLNPDKVEALDRLRILMHLGYIAWMQSNNTQARQYFENGVELAKSHKETRYLAYLFGGLGLVSAAEMNTAAAHAYYQQSMEHAQIHNDFTIQASVTANMACLSLEAHEFDRAEQEFLRSREIRESIGDMPGIAYIDLYLAHTEEWRGNLVSARSGYVVALQCLYETEQLYYISWGLAFLSNVLVKLEELRAAAYVRGFLSVFRERYGFTANPTQHEAEERDQTAITALLGRQGFDTIVRETQNWTIEQALEYIQQSVK